TEGTPMNTTAMSTDAATATIKEAGKAVEITDRARLIALGDPEAEARRQFGVLASRKDDADLIAQAQADETAQGGGTPLTDTNPGSGAGVAGKLGWGKAMAPPI